ncbi:uncharacterized protein RSE6_06690 [Rhynchosporium secalis]|uniref:Uncharacterized protein n=1 Tax=Rhynchosporium secalis TaxID=38038 RepID=A0A1E1MAY7_RHYSE|nr:uncharacterized protein RSE6_06690 [Rhynchosporium secalis]
MSTDPENKSKALPIIDALEEPGKIAKEDKVEEDPQDEAKDPDHGDEDKSSSSVEDNDDDEDNDETSETPRILRPMQFYSPSPLPSRLSQDVYYKPEIDTLFFPAWCWSSDILGFEERVGAEVMGRIRGIALENLMWMSYWPKGTVNRQITISQFKGLKEFIYTIGDLTQCGCCVEWDNPGKVVRWWVWGKATPTIKPERGMVEFAEIEYQGGLAKENQVVNAMPALLEDRDANTQAESDTPSGRSGVDDEGEIGVPRRQTRGKRGRR